MKKRSVSISKPYFNEQEAKAATAVLKSGWVVQGPKVKELEAAFCTYTDSKYALATTSCTTALHLSLLAAGVGRGDEVIVPSFTFIATPNSVLQAGGTPVFADVEEKTLNIDPADVERKITKKTKAIMFVDQAGMTANYGELSKIAKKHNLVLIADAACGLGSKYKGKEVGSLADISCFSLHAKKLVTCGEGGIITTNNKEFAKKVEILRNHGASVSDFERHKAGKIIDEQYVMMGYNFRLSDIHAAIAVVQMKKLDTIIKRREKNGHRYNKGLKDIPFISVPFIPEYATNTYQSYIIQVHENKVISRDKLMNKLMEDGIVTRKGIFATHLQPFYREMYPKLSLPVTERVAQNVLCLPIYADMKNEDQDYVIERIKYHTKQK
jgi:dTDP-4-amino-4,6-dideoxygalactose transaminase